MRSILKVLKLEGLNNIYIVATFMDDFSNLFGKNKGDTKRYREYLFRWLKRLDEEGLSVLSYDQFEKLEDTDIKLYAIRHPNSQINERYIFITGYKNGYILLTSFLEKSTDDYNNAIRRSQNIYRQLELE